MISRLLQKTIESRLFAGKAIIVIGARQVGKSTLSKLILEKQDYKALQLNCDEPEVRDMLSNINTAELRLLIADNRIVVIDEAQRVENIGMTLKLITDNFPEVQLLVTGSSSFELQDKLNEPLTGRKYEYHLYPISTAELMASNGLLGVKQTLEQRLAAKHGFAFYLVTNNGEGESWIFVAIFASLVASLDRSAKLNNVGKVVPLCRVHETHL